METAITNGMVFSAVLARTQDTHKGNYGKVLAVCGTPQYRGAAALSVLGALRTGAGLVQLAASETVLTSVASRILEATFLPLPNDAALQEAAGACTVCLAGCGLAQSNATAEQIKMLLARVRGILVLDAGGLTSMAGNVASLKACAGRLILTPHPGEMAKLCSTSVEQVLRLRGEAALRLAESTGGVVVLKGHRTLVATPGGMLYKNTTGNAGLARGGSGDILAGMIAGLCAVGLTPEMAAGCGVYLHGLAGDRCAARKSQAGMLPEDILDDLTSIFLENGR